MPSWAWVVLLWAVMYLPYAGSRELRWEEGRRGLQARAMVEEGHWVHLTVSGKRYVSKPPLLPWLMAGSSHLTGGLNEWAVRLPSLVAVLITALLVYRMTADQSSTAAGVFAAVAFFLTPLVIERGRLGETDALAMCCSFGALYVWLRPLKRQSFRLLQCSLAGLILGVGVLAKGPPAAVHFGLGILVLLLWQRRLKEIPMLFLALAVAHAGVIVWSAAVYRPGDVDHWLQQMRIYPESGNRATAFLIARLKLFVETPAGFLPWLLLAIPTMFPMAVPQLRRRLDIQMRIDPTLVAYAVAATLWMCILPGNIHSRYALPVAGPVAVACGLTFASLLTSQRNTANRLARFLVWFSAILICVRVIGIMVWKHEDPIRATAKNLNLVLDEAPARKVVLDGHQSLYGDCNLFFYLDHAVKEMTPAEFESQGGPSTIFLVPGLFETNRSFTARFRLDPIPSIATNSPFTARFQLDPIASIADGRGRSMIVVRVRERPLDSRQRPPEDRLSKDRIDP